MLRKQGWKVWTEKLVDAYIIKSDELCWNVDLLSLSAVMMKVGEDPLICR